MEQKLWYKAKTYGWGWVPATWEGWTVLGVWIVTMTLIAATAGERLGENPSAIELVKLLVAYALLTSALIITCYVHGEKPEWRWGNKK